jgi:hypothetical protein
MIMNKEEPKRSADTGSGASTRAEKAEARREEKLVSTNHRREQARRALIWAIGRIVLDTKGLDPRIMTKVIGELSRTERGRSILERAKQAEVLPVQREVRRPHDGCESSYTGADLLNRYRS